MRMHKIAGVVLCGGRSSRMGRNKAQLEYRGLPLFEHMGELLRQAGMENVFLSGPDGIPDLLPDLGPLGGMHACMNLLAGQFTHTLFVPTDMPLLTPAQIRNLAFHQSDAEALHYAEQIFPLRLSLSGQTKNHLDLQIVESGQCRSIRNFIARLNTHCLPSMDCDADSFANVNTPKDWHLLNRPATE